jgi:tetratricopeptide (TPR) repeat protein
VVCGNPQIVGDAIKFCTLPRRQNYTLIAADKRKYVVPVKNIRFLGQDLDLTIIQFQSDRNYQIAQVAAPGSLKVDDGVYTAGFPAGQGWLFGSGKAYAVVNKRLVGDRGGYTVIYDAETLPGMSGGGAFNRNGQLVAVHGSGDRYTKNTQATVEPSNTVKEELNSKTGYNRGIPVRWVVNGLNTLGIFLGNSRVSQPPSAANPAKATTADEFFIAGFNKLVDPGEDFQAGKRAAVSQFDRALSINPRYTIAYFMRALVKSDLNDSKGALADYARAIALNPQYAKAYYARGILKQTELNDPQGALADYDRAIALNPKYVEAYYNRGTLKQEKLNDPQGALADYNKAIALNPKLAAAYGNRGFLKKNQLNNPQGAIADLRTAARLFRAQGQTQYLQVVLNDLRALGATENP